MNFILFDNLNSDHLLPLNFTKPVSEFRIGIDTLREKWEYYFESKASYLTKDYLSVKYELHLEEDNFFVDASLIPNKNLVKAISILSRNEALIGKDNELLALRLSMEDFDKNNFHNTMQYKKSYFEDDYFQIKKPYDLFSLNQQIIEFDFDRICSGRISEKLSDTVQVLGNGQIFIEEGAKVEACTPNTSKGPIYIVKNAEIMEGSNIRGPFALCESSTVKMGGKIYGASTIGPHCKVGGELNNVVIFGYSNKAHDGFLGNAVIGEWCNLGADTNNSNLKNNYTEVKLWNYVEQRFAGTGVQFCGLIMGDHSKSAINTMFNTGTVVGVFANIFGAGFPRNFIPSFSWGGPQGMKEYKFTAAMYVAKLVMQRRGIELDDKEKNILRNVFELTKQFHKF